METELPEAFGPYCDGRSCALEVARGLKALAGRWSVPLVEALHFAAHPLRFTDLKRCAGAISAKELTRHLDHLVEHGVVQRRGGAGRSPTYELTQRGRALLGVMQAIGEWGAHAAGGLRKPATWMGPLGAAADQPSHSKS